MWPNAKYRIVKSLQIMPLKECAMHSLSPHTSAVLRGTALFTQRRPWFVHFFLLALLSFSFCLFFSIFRLALSFTLLPVRPFLIFLSVNIIIGAAFYVITEYNNKTFWLCSRNHLFPLRNNIYFAEKEFFRTNDNRHKTKARQKRHFPFRISILEFIALSISHIQCVLANAWNLVLRFYLRSTTAFFSLLFFSFTLSFIRAFFLFSLFK